MPRACSICIHSKRDEIESGIVAGISYRNIAEQYGVSLAPLSRHASEHIAQSIKQSRDAKEAAQALNVVQQLREINEVTRAIVKESRSGKNKKNGMALFAIDRIQKQLELQAKLLGDLDDRPQVNIILSPEWQTIRNTIVQALKPFADARVAVSDALMRLENDRARLN